VDVAVIGAAGAVGRAVCGQLLATGVLGPGERLQLVGHRGGASETGIFGLRIDLLDAYSLTAPAIEPVLDPADIRADVIIMVAGQTPSNSPEAGVSRDDVASANLSLFRAYARDLATHGRGHELVLIQSNPVELAVRVFAEQLGAARVLGAGAYNDSQRFRREVADGYVAFCGGQVRYPIVTGYMLGEHGPAVVPMWSTLQAHGVDPSQWAAYLAQARGGRSPSDLATAAAASRSRLAALLSEHRGEEAFGYVNSLPPDIRAAVKPWYAHWASGTSTVTAHSVVEIVAQLRRGHRLVLPLQVACTDDDWPGRAGVVGLAVDVDLAGWHASTPLAIPDDERTALLAAIDAIGQRLASWESA